jgi:hypothetical protein
MITARFSVCNFLLVAIACATISYTNADEISLISVPGFTTGANINALAGPLAFSDLSSVDIAGSGSDSASAMLSGNFATHVSGVELDFSGGGTAFFDSVYDAPFARTSTLDHRASAESIFHFAVDVPTSFEIMGAFGVVDDDGTTVPGNVELEIELLEFDAFDMAATPVFYNYQVSKSSLDAGFMVGGTDGDTTNVLVGDPFGILDPSKVYMYRTLVTTNAIDIDGTGSLPPTDGGATAMGGHTILFSAVTAVPEPSTACMFGFIVLISPLARRRRG